MGPTMDLGNRYDIRSDRKYHHLEVYQHEYGDCRFCDRWGIVWGSGKAILISSSHVVMTLTYFHSRMRSPFCFAATSFCRARRDRAS
jgi:hypothetical protein